MTSPVFAFYLTCLFLVEMGELRVCDSNFYLLVVSLQILTDYVELYHIQLTIHLLCLLFHFSSDD